MKWLLKFSLLMLIHLSVFGQTPEKMSYQAVIRDNSDVLLNNSNVNLKIILRQGSPKGTIVYEETHHTKTNKNGLLSLEIGTGTIEKGKFNEINWAQGPFFIETLVDIKGNSNYKINGISQMLSVPYALHAKSADTFTGAISPSQMADYYTADEIDKILLDFNTEGGVNQSSKFSGVYGDLKNIPPLYDKTEIDNLIEGIEITGDTVFSGYDRAEIDNLISGIETSGGSPQDLVLDGNTLTISGGNSISFENWDTNAADNFSGVYADLQNKPELYDKTEIDNLIQNIETNGGSNFSGNYVDLQNKPDLYGKTEIDNLIQGIETTGGSPQVLSLEGKTLSISGGNSISFEDWAGNDFDGAYSSLTGSPKIYTQDEIDNIKAELLKEVDDNYTKKAKVLSFTSSRNVSNTDVGNTIACIYSTTLTITSGFSAMKVGDVINLEVHGTTLTVNGASGVVINGKSGGFTSIGNDEVYTGGIIRKTNNNSYIIL